MCSTLFWIEAIFDATGTWEGLQRVTERQAIGSSTSYGVPGVAPEPVPTAVVRFYSVPFRLPPKTHQNGPEKNGFIEASEEDMVNWLAIKKLSKNCPKCKLNIDVFHTMQLSKKWIISIFIT